MARVRRFKIGEAGHGLFVILAGKVDLARPDESGGRRRFLTYGPRRGRRGNGSTRGQTGAGGRLREGTGGSPAHFGSWMRMKAFTKAKPTDVARKSFTYKSESAISTVAPDWPGALSKKKRNGHLQDLCCSRLAPIRLAF
jgi:hypothetical protein